MLSEEESVNEDYDQFIGESQVLKNTGRKSLGKNFSDLKIPDIKSFSADLDDCQS
jgi:hypothetical protein